VRGVAPKGGAKAAPKGGAGSATKLVRACRKKRAARRASLGFRGLRGWGVGDCRIVPFSFTLKGCGGEGFGECRIVPFFFTVQCDPASFGVHYIARLA